jgi:hypothetical protein
MGGEIPGIGFEVSKDSGGYGWCRFVFSNLAILC